MANNGRQATGFGVAMFALLTLAVIAAQTPRPASDVEAASAGRDGLVVVQLLRAARSLCCDKPATTGGRP